MVRLHAEMSIIKNLATKAKVAITRFTRTTERQHCEAVTHLWVSGFAVLELLRAGVHRDYRKNSMPEVSSTKAGTRAGTPYPTKPSTPPHRSLDKRKMGSSTTSPPLQARASNGRRRKTTSSVSPPSSPPSSAIFLPTPRQYNHPSSTQTS